MRHRCDSRIINYLTLMTFDTPEMTGTKSKFRSKFRFRLYSVPATGRNFSGILNLASSTPSNSFRFERRLSCTEYLYLKWGHAAEMQSESKISSWECQDLQIRMLKIILPYLDMHVSSTGMCNTETRDGVWDGWWWSHEMLEDSKCVEVSSMHQATGVGRNISHLHIASAPRLWCIKDGWRIECGESEMWTAVDGAARPSWWCWWDGE